ncbi:hypothetical protein ACT453_53005, partial [Bacillus sp. D-CC]
MKQHAGFSCAQSQIAQAEVMLVWAAAEHCELGWRHSRELFLSALQIVGRLVAVQMFLNSFRKLVIHPVSRCKL